jgi:hypothetical protein
LTHGRVRRLAAPLAAALLLAGRAGAYPLDGWEHTGIARLEAFDLAQAVLLQRGTIRPGATRRMDEVRLGLVDYPDFRIPPADPGFSADIRGLLGSDAPAYGIAVLDITDPAHPFYAEVNPNNQQNPGSVGKITVALALFQALAEAHPLDVEARNRVLRDTVIPAQVFAQPDDHVVPFWKRGEPSIHRRPLRPGDEANLWTWLDWMLSASSNGAGSTVMAQLVALEHFGPAYPPSRAQLDAFLLGAPPGELGGILGRAMLAGLRKNDIDPSKLRQGSPFTRGARARMAGSLGSTSTARELVHFLTRMEQGKLVDPWSSLELKRLLYLTDIRIRYAAEPALDTSAVYYKSGSLYACGGSGPCGKYMGNRKNYMNSIAIVEYDGGTTQLRYIVALLSNVLHKNSIEVHQALARRIHSVIAARHGVTLPPPTRSPERIGSQEGDVLGVLPTGARAPETPR